jgi:hypothetical protein
MINIICAETDFLGEIGYLEWLLPLSYRFFKNNKLQDLAIGLLAN